MREEKTKQIGSHSYLVRQLPATQAQRLFVRLSKLVGPALAEVTNGGAAGLKGAAMQLFSQLNEQDVEDITKQMAKMSEVDGRQLSACFDVHFTGLHSELWQWLMFALEVQFQDFFDVVIGALSAGQAGQAKDGLPSQSIFGGPPGA